MRWWWASPPVRSPPPLVGEPRELAPGPLHSPHHRPRRSQHDSLSPTEDADPRLAMVPSQEKLDGWRQLAARRCVESFGATEPAGNGPLLVAAGDLDASVLLYAGHGTTHPSSCSSKKPAADLPIYGAVAESTRGPLSTPTGSCTTSFGPSSHHWRRPLLPTSPAVSDPALPV